MKGTLDKPFKLTIVGFGPGGLSVLIKALRLQLLDELCAGKDDSKNGGLSGVCVIDRQDFDKVGGGKLQEYIINSNTFSEKFVTNIVNPRTQWEPPESLNDTIYKSFEQSTYAVILRECGLTRVSLQTVGNYLMDLSKVILPLIKQYDDSDIYSRTEVISIQRIVHKRKMLWKINMKRYFISSYSNSSSSSSLSNVNLSETQYEEVTIYTLNVCLATGGSQTIPQLPLLRDKSKLINSDTLCMESTYQTIFDKYHHTSMKHVVIVGGSHSAFSCAWILLNRWRIDVEKDTNKTTRNTDKTNSNKKSFTKLPNSGNKENDTNTVNPKFTIYILHRSPIKVYYNNKLEADRDNYTDYTSTHTQTGAIHQFGGIRGDAKILWQRIKNGQETRIKLIQIREGYQGNLLQTLYDQASFVIWAGGYKTNLPPVYNEQGENMNIKYEDNGNQVNITDTGHLIEILPISCAHSHIEKDEDKASTTQELNSIMLPKIDDSIQTTDSITHIPESTIITTEDISNPNKTTLTECNMAANTNNIADTNSISNTSVINTTIERPIQGLMGIGLGYGLITYDEGEPIVTTTTTSTTILSKESKSATNLSATATITNTSTPNKKNSTDSRGNTGINSDMNSKCRNATKSVKNNNCSSKCALSQVRADGVAVYIKHAASLILASVLSPEKVYGRGCKTWDEYIIKNQERWKQSLLEEQNVSTCTSIIETPSISTPSSSSSSMAPISTPSSSSSSAMAPISTPSSSSSSAMAPISTPSSSSSSAMAPISTPSSSSSSAMAPISTPSSSSSSAMAPISTPSSSSSSAMAPISTPLSSSSAMVTVGAVDHTYTTDIHSTSSTTTSAVDSFHSSAKVSDTPPTLDSLVTDLYLESTIPVIDSQSNGQFIHNLEAIDQSSHYSNHEADNTITSVTINGSNINSVLKPAASSESGICTLPKIVSTKSLHSKQHMSNNDTNILKTIKMEMNNNKVLVKSKSKSKSNMKKSVSSTQLSTNSSSSSSTSLISHRAKSSNTNSKGTISTAIISSLPYRSSSLPAIKS